MRKQSAPQTPVASHAVRHDPSEAERFLAVVGPHMGAALQVAKALVGHADAEDATQEAVLRGLASWANLRDLGAARGWLLRITYNVCADWQRGRFGTARRLTQSLPDDDGPPALLGADPGASDHAAALDLRQAINRLDRDLRVALVLRYYAGMDASEIAALLGLPPSTIRSRIARALTVLRREFAPVPDTGDRDRQAKGGQ